MVQGRKPNLKRWARIQRLRDAGLTLAQIGRRLGMTNSSMASKVNRRTVSGEDFSLPVVVTTGTY